MLSENARSSVGQIMKIGCLLKIYPYSWDPAEYRLKPAPVWHLAMYHLRRYVVLINFLFMFFRLIHSVKDDIPSRIRIMNLIWVLAYGLGVLCNIQFEIRRGAILFFANTLMHELDRTRRTEVVAVLKNSPDTKSSKKAKTTMPLEKDKEFDWTSFFVLISTFLLITNPPAHSTVLFDLPCAPQYLSSLVFNCKDPMDDTAPTLYKLLFVILENWIISDIMFAWTFNWVFTFLGFTWLKTEMKRFEGTIVQNKKSPLDFDVAVTHYRRNQVLLAILNDAFKLYLQNFPSILFTIAGMLLFGTIRYPNLPFNAYIVFPFCGIRCIFEAGTALSAGGLVNQESKNYMLQWDREIDGIQDGDIRTYLRTFRRSCQDLKCMAGSIVISVLLPAVQLLVQKYPLVQVICRIGMLPGCCFVVGYLA